MKSSSLKLMTEVGISNPREYRDMLIHDWFVPPEIKERLDLFFIAMSDSDELMYAINDGEVKVNGKNYSVIWIQSPETVYKNDKALMSFRYCRYLQRGYVLVKKLEGGNKEHHFNPVEFDKPRELKELVKK